MDVNRRRFLAALPAAGVVSRMVGAAQPPAPADPLGVRADFPAADASLYLDAAYITPTPLSVVEAGREFAESKSRRPIPLGDMLQRTDRVRASFARLIGAAPEEVGFLFSTSEGENIVARALAFKPGDNVVVDELHYNTTFVLYRHLEKTTGVELRIARARDGAIDADDFGPLVDRRTRLVSIAWVSHQNGFRHDTRPIADLAHRHGAWLYADAVQAVGMFPIDVRASGVDVMTTGTYKWLLASYGVAPFYVRSDLLDRIPPDRMGALHVERELPGHRFEIYKTAKKFDYATLAFGPVYQLDAALAYLDHVGVHRIESHTVALADELARGLRARELTVLTPPGNRSSIVAFGNPTTATAARTVLDRASTRVSLRENGAQIRVSPALFNTSNDIARFLDVADELKRLARAHARSNVFGITAAGGPASP
jgi:selenocysteine lyase/cysteine desulfurase